MNVSSNHVILFNLELQNGDEVYVYLSKPLGYTCENDYSLLGFECVPVVQ